MEPTRFWDRLSVEDRRSIVETGVRRRFENGVHLFREGDEPSHVVILRQGRLKLTRTSSAGREVLIELRHPGQLVGELGVIDRQMRSTTATALGPVEIISIPADRFDRLLRERATIGIAVLQSVTARLRHSVSRRLEAGSGGAMTQLCGRLVELADGLPADADGSIEIASPLTQQELADWVGFSRDAVVLVLRRLREAGLVETGRRRIKIVDLDALRRAAIG